jgi:hypothetical protein
MSGYDGPVRWARGARVGDTVTSIWSGSGAIWEVTEVHELRKQSGVSGSYAVSLKSLKSGRTDIRWLRDLKFTTTKESK